MSEDLLWYQLLTFDFSLPLSVFGLPPIAFRPRSSAFNINECNVKITLFWMWKQYSM